MSDKVVSGYPNYVPDFGAEEERLLPVELPEMTEPAQSSVSPSTSRALSKLQ